MCLLLSLGYPIISAAIFVVRTVLVALIGFMPTKGEGAIGALDYTPEERQQLAKKSVSYVCPRCGICNATALPSPSECPSTPIEEDLPPFIFAGEATSSNNSNSSSSSSTSGGSGSGQTTESGKRSADASLQQQKEKEKEKDEEAATKEEEAERGSTVATVENDRQEQQLPQSPQLQQRHQQEVLRQQLQPQVAAAAIAPNAIVVTESTLRRLDYVIVALLFLITALFWKKYLV
ncbi:Ubiquitin-conjugating enzyme E2 J1, variant 2 [Balamuthia mandrillaris]